MRGKQINIAIKVYKFIMVVNDDYSLWANSHPLNGTN